MALQKGQSLPDTTKITELTRPSGCPRKNCDGKDCNGTGIYVKTTYPPEGVSKEIMMACPHRAELMLKKRIGDSMIDEQFLNAKVNTYIVTNPTQAEMKRAAIDYLNSFGKWEDDSKKSLGYVANVGESRIKAIVDQRKRVQEKDLHNSFGLGKTHLTSAVGMEIIRRGMSVLAVRDVDLMATLMDLKRGSEGEYESYINKLIKAPALLWDDIGKSNPSEAKQTAYYTVIDARSRQKKLILWSTNEDLDSLADRIGDGAASRLVGMTRNLVICEGEDWRLKQ